MSVVKATYEGYFTADRRRCRTRERVQTHSTYRVMSNEVVYRSRVSDGPHADAVVDHLRMFFARGWVISSLLLTTGMYYEFSASDLMTPTAWSGVHDPPKVEKSRVESSTVVGSGVSLG